MLLDEARRHLAQPLERVVQRELQVLQEDREVHDRPDAHLARALVRRVELDVAVRVLDAGLCVAGCWL